MNLLKGIKSAFDPKNILNQENYIISKKISFINL
ncbi:MAG: hypothetical protein ACLTK8_02430 [Paeniclostridium sp.]